ncbi:hypothetical protein [Pseudarthrobacter sp. NIBRBAC000502772]|nr:hypothetical protein [Pseudarthrobacter sp. NIBRBAC000502772]
MRSSIKEMPAAFEPTQQTPEEQAGELEFEWAATPGKGCDP